MGFIRSVPIDLEEAAYLDGCNVFQIYFKIIIPVAKPSFATVAIFSFLWSYNDLFTQTFFLRYPKEKTITLLINEISSQAGVNYGLMAASVVLVVGAGADRLRAAAKEHHQGPDRRRGQRLMRSSRNIAGLWYNGREGASR